MKLFLKILYTLFFLCNVNIVFSQDIDFHTPIDAPFDLSGTFGEYRSRFHTGIDFKSRGVLNQKIFSIEEGYISRIEVNNYGYGKVIYIDHPNGYTSVYAHLNNFNTEIDTYIKSEHYKLKSSTLKKFPKKDELKVKKGELIGYSGNTGGSFGPHLHFEIRDTDTQDALNPLIFNYEYLDTERPIIRGLYLIDEENTLVSSLPVKKEIRKLNDSTYTTDDIEYSKKTGLGIDIYDIQYKGLFNQNGVYKVDLLIDSILVYSFKMDRIKFSQNHYRKIMYDYISAIKNKIKVLKVFTPRNADLSFLRNNDFNGILDPIKYLNSDISIRVSDWNNNSSYLNFRIKATDSKDEIFTYDGIEILTNQNYEINKNLSLIEIRKNSFYNDLLLNISYERDTLDLGEDKNPFRSSITIKIPQAISDTLELRQSFIGRVKDEKITYINSKRDDSYIYAKTSSLGKYIISRDTVKPDIRPINFKQNSNISNRSSIRLRLKDDISGIKSYNAFLNGKWALFEYEPKLNLIFHNISDKIINEGENTLIINYQDGVGNKGIYKATIYY
ncbi:MAG: M23 family metallopeptidase [Candidatus Marisimplicoccus sp.]|tara:strand:- start:1133 stop:2800 length:1668 start_codon:yes stop_codon:yes gene_type:complete